jgi:hypothetical protein
MPADYVQCAWIKRVVAAQPIHDVAGTHSKAFVNRVRLAGVFFAHPVGEMLLVFPNDFDTAIRAPAIDNYVLKIWVFLFDNRANRCFQRCRLVQAGRHQANPGPFDSGTAKLRCRLERHGRIKAS